MKTRSLAALLLGALALALPATTGAQSPGQARLLARAVLPANTFAPGPPSAAARHRADQRRRPRSPKPVQGGRGRQRPLPQMPDNAMAIRTGRLRPPRLHDPPAARDGSAAPERSRCSDIELHDPGHRSRSRSSTTSPATVLTGATSTSSHPAPATAPVVRRRVQPFLIHTDPNGRVLHALPAAGPGIDPTHPQSRARAEPVLRGVEHAADHERASADARSLWRQPRRSPDANLLDDATRPTTTHPHQPACWLRPHPPATTS